jgi:hypothetical protein
MLLGCALAYGLHLLKPIVSSVSAVNELTAFPVLGVVNVAFPSRRQQETRRHMRRFSAAMACLVVALLIALGLNWVGARLVTQTTISSVTT